MRDRFRNAFPDLYQAAGYKPRSASKKKLLLDGMGVGRAADDHQLSTTAGPVRSRRRAKTSQGLLRGGTKSVPQSTVCSEDEESEEEESESSQVFKTPPMPVFVENVSTATYRPPTKKSQTTTTATATTTSSMPTLSSTADTQVMDADDEMELLTLDSTDALNIPDFLPNNVHSDMETWSSGLNTPTHSSTAAWSTAAVSPTSSHLSDLFMNATAASTTSSASSPFIQRRSGSNSFTGGNGNGTSIDNNFGMIGKSAWGTDWFSPNPRLDARSATCSNSNSHSSFMDPANFSPASPFSFQGHGVLDRYDLFPPYMPDGNVSEAGLGDAFGDDEMGGGGSAGNGAGASSGGTGFKGYHSQIAGDLISGDGARMHHHHYSHHHHTNHHQPTAFSLSSLYGTSFGSAFGNPATADGGASSSSSAGLGLEGIPENVNVPGIHPMQLHSHAHSSSSLGVVGEVGGGEGLGEGSAGRGPVDDDAMDEGQQQQPSQVQGQEKREGGGDIGASSSSTSAAASVGDGRSNEPDMDEEDTSLLPFEMEDFVDMNELHRVTPPGTPLVTQPRPMRSSESWLGGVEGGFSGFGSGFSGFGGGGGGGGGGGNGGGGHARSISVPPSEAARNGHHMHEVGVPMSVDDVGLHSMHLGLGYHGFGGMGGLHSVFGAAAAATGGIFSSSSASDAASGSTEDQRFQERQNRTVDPQRLSGSGVGVVHSPTSPSGISLHRQQHQPQQHQHQHHQQQDTQLDVDDDDDDDQHQHTSELTPLFPVNLILSPAAAATSISLPSSSSSQSEHAHAHTHANGSSAGGGSRHHTPVIDHRHTPIIDHRHTPVIDHRHTPTIDHDHDQQREELWRSASSASSLGLTFSGDYNLPFLDLHYYYGGAGSSMFGSSNHGQMNPHHPNHPHLLHSHSHPHHGHPHPHQHLHNTLGLDVTSIDDLYSATTAGMTVEATRQGLALDLAQTNAQMGSFGGIGLGNNHHMAAGNPNGTNPNLAPGRFQRTPSPSGTIRLHQPQQQRRKPLLSETFSPPDQAVDVVSPNANEDGGRRRLSDSNNPSNSNVTNTSNNTSPSKSMNRSSSDDSRAGGGRATTRVRKSMTAGIKSLTNAVRATAATTTTTTTTMPPTTTTMIGRSMSHHRGQSAVNAAASSVCPQDLMLRNGDTHKRKRASWDGGLG